MSTLIVSILYIISLSIAFKTPNKNGFMKSYPTSINDVAGSLLDEKIETETSRIGTVFDIFSSKDSIFSTDDITPDNTFILPSTKAWINAITAPEAPQVVAPPRDVNPPDVVSFLKTGELPAYHEERVRVLMTKTTSLSYFSATEAALILMAMRIAYCAFWGKRTERSHEVLIDRARGTAEVLGELKADVNVVVAGILHDIKVDVPASQFYNEIRPHLTSMFGDQTVGMVESYSRLPHLFSRKTSYTPVQSENQMQMLVALAEQYQVLYLRIADRLHSLRVLRSLPIQDSERLKIAQEALNVYAPLAHKMGLMKVKGELEDEAFRVINPDLFLESKRTQWIADKALHDGYNKIQDVLSQDPFLTSQNVTYRMPYRVKDKYQLALKMARKNLKSLSEVRDAVGMRIIIDAPRFEGESEQEHNSRSEKLCYYIVDKVRGIEGWEPAAEKGFKDYIQQPKGNGYQSLHQYIRHLALDSNLEVQVRTRQMHMQAELGEAAHWNYKDNMYRPDIASSKYYNIAWRSPEQQKAKSAAELIGLAKKQLNAQRVFVFLEDEATVLNLSKGATSLDAAFAIHTNVGLTARSISVSDEPCGMKRVMRNGDVLSVECGSAVSAAPSWLAAARLPYTKGVLRKHLRQKHQNRIFEYRSQLYGYDRDTRESRDMTSDDDDVAEKNKLDDIVAEVLAVVPPVVSVIDTITENGIPIPPSRASIPFWAMSAVEKVQGPICPRIQIKSQISRAQKPYSLEGSSISEGLQRLAKRHVAASVLKTRAAW